MNTVLVSFIAALLFVSAVSTAIALLCRSERAEVLSVMSLFVAFIFGCLFLLLQFV